MHPTRGFVLLTGLLAACSSTVATAAPALLRTVEPLDEPRGYCLDISGSGPTLDLEAPLQAHTCKGLEPIDDQLFEASGQQIRASEHDRCLAVEALEPGQPVRLRPCSDSRMQRWHFAEGRLSPQLAKAFPIRDAEVAFAELASNTVAGKVVLVIDESLI